MGAPHSWLACDGREVDRTVFLLWVTRCVQSTTHIRTARSAFVCVRAPGSTSMHLFAETTKGLPKNDGRGLLRGVGVSWWGRWEFFGSTRRRLSVTIVCLVWLGMICLGCCD